METVKPMGIKRRDLGLDYAIITLIVAYIFGTIVQALFKISAGIL